MIPERLKSEDYETRLIALVDVLGFRKLVEDVDEGIVFFDRVAQGKRPKFDPLAEISE